MAGSTDRYRSIPLIKAARPRLEPPRQAMVRTPMAQIWGAAARPALADDGQARAAASPPGTIRFQARRFLPPASALPAAATYVVRPGDRIDLIAARLLGNPLLYWMIADANDSTDIPSLCRSGRRLRIPAPTADIDSAAARARMFATGDARGPDDPQ
jgi:nucleoid-associated protein YgaU